MQNKNQQFELYLPRHKDSLTLDHVNKGIIWAENRVIAGYEHIANSVPSNFRYQVSISGINITIKVQTTT